MKLYRKKLNSVEELKRECIRLKYRRKHTDAKDLVPDFNAGAKKRGSKNPDVLEMALGLINAKGPLQTALAVAGPVMGMIGKSQKKATGTSAPKKILGNLVKEVVTGYLFGKAAQLAIRGVGWYLKQRRKKRELKKIEAQFRTSVANT